MSQYFRGPNAKCTPWAMPEVFITVPTMFVVGFYIVFALIAALLSFSLNVLARQTRSQFSGRAYTL